MTDWTKITSYPLDTPSAETHRHASALVAEQIQTRIFLEFAKKAK